MLKEVGELADTLIDGGMTIATAESCTGGLVAAALTDIAGVSKCFMGGVVAYANEAKQRLLGVPEAILAEFGAVSAECAKAMASGAREKFGTDWAVSTTGIAGPGGATPGKPVGLVFIGVAGPDCTTAVEMRFSGGRAAVRSAAVEAAIGLVLKRAGEGR